MRTCAKINLYLRITGKRADGYHELETLFWPLHWLYDEVTVALETEGIHLECDSPGVPCDSRNLCWKAVTVFLEDTGLAAGVRICLAKRIPVAAGLGGGSSDAAAVLLQLRDLLAPTMATEYLAELAVKLGADVPFFLNPVPALARGVGECLEPIGFSGEPDLLLVNPGFPIPAAWSYAHWRDVPQSPAPPLDDLLAAVREGAWEKAASLTHNDLGPCAMVKFPLLGMIAERMESYGVREVRVSGSGPTLFGFCTAVTPDDVTTRLESDFPGTIRCFRKKSLP
ncbi:MAG: 4-(cytidine 5'-diphospho)-2-C-methyl-D-erythritol kinase [Victivallales bacterium]|nr:4-(cytidine 5'-diphospho)-2-C-methyl-D-erythritol kinase [Victivallales bacterium]